MGMLILHELGHVLHAVLSGGHITGVKMPLLGFSQTLVDPNPHPLFVVVGGPLWGALLPVTLLVTTRLISSPILPAMRFFAGFCLIANGVYIGLGWSMRAGDAADLLRHGAPLAALLCFGIVSTVAGLWVWHKTPALSSASATHQRKNLLY